MLNLKPAKKHKFMPVIVRNKVKKKWEKDAEIEMTTELPKSLDLFEPDEDVNMINECETTMSIDPAEMINELTENNCEHFDQMIADDGELIIYETDENSMCENMIDEKVSMVTPKIPFDSPTSFGSERIDINEIIKCLVSQTNDSQTASSNKKQDIPTTQSNSYMDSLSTDELVHEQSLAEDHVNRLFIEVEKSS